MREARVPGLLYVRTKSHQTSMFGKGGASAVLTFSRKGLEPRKIAFMCAHLDSESDDQRHRGVVQQMAEALGWHSTYFVNKKMQLCNLFDARHSWCKPEESIKQKALADREKYKTDPGDIPTDAGVVVGDLNYRTVYTLKDGKRVDIFPEELKSSPKGMPEYVYSKKGRQALAKYDPLNPGSAEPAFLVAPAPNGLGFECNAPYNDSMPTYKRVGDKYCGHLHRQMAICKYMSTNQSSKEYDRNCEKDNLDRLTQLCFAPDGKWKLKDNGKIKNKFLQLGWLDRVCYRKARGSTISIKTVSERGWDAFTGSDHAPMESTLEFEDDNLSLVPLTQLSKKSTSQRVLADAFLIFA